jgi:hypothetical protein
MLRHANALLERRLEYSMSLGPFPPSLRHGEARRSAKRGGGRPVILGAL